MKIIEQDAMPGEKERVGRVVAILALAAILVHATQASVDVLAWMKGARLNVCLVDLVLGAAFAAWFIRRVQRLDLSWPPVSFAALFAAFWLLVSLLPFLKPDDIRVGLKLGVLKTVQFVEYFVVAYLVFGEVLTDARWRRWAVKALIVATSFAVLCALAQYFSGGALVTAVRGSWFANRNTFGAFLALVLPILFGAAVFDRLGVARLGLGVMLLAALCVCLSGGAFLAICVGLLVVAALKGRFRFVLTVAILLLLAVAVLPRLPRRNSKALLDSVLLYRDDDPFQLAHDNIIEEKIKPALPAKIERLRERILEKKRWSRADLPLETDYSWKWRQRYKEWQAALNMAALCPLVGVGAGSYQANVNQFYEDIPKYHEDLLEPDTLSGYMIWASTAGLPFLAALLWMFLSAGRSACGILVKETDRERRGLAAGALGSLAALAILCVFTNPLVRGVGVTMALVMALAEGLQRSSPGAPAPSPVPEQDSGQ